METKNLNTITFEAWIEHVRKNLDVEHQRVYDQGVEYYLRSYRTLVMDFGRETGKTHFAKQLLKNTELKTIVVTPTWGMVNLYRDMGRAYNLGCFAHLIPEHNVFTDADIVVFDEVGYYSSAKRREEVIDKIYATLPQTAIVIFLGRRA